MNKFKYFLISVISLLLLSSCKQFFADLAEDLSYWSSTAFIKGELFPSRIYKDNEGYSCISSFSSALAQPDGSVSITLKLSNPKSYMFKMPGGAGVPDDIIVFEKNVKGTAGNAPSVNADYTMSQTDSTTIVLTLKNNFLQKSEWGSQNLSPTITLYNKDGRIFPQKYTFKLRANTPPPDLEYMATGKTKTAENGKHYYVLCFKVKNKDDMSKTVIGGELLHKDIAAISITPQGGAAQSIPLTLNASNTDFNINNSGGLLLPAGNVIKLSSADVDTGTTPDDLPSGNWVLFYKTGVEVKAAAAKTQYKIALEDEKGVRSAILTAGVKAPKPAPGPTLSGLTVEHGTPPALLAFRDSDDTTDVLFNAGTLEYYVFVPDITEASVTVNATPSPGASSSITAVKSDGTALPVSGNSVPLPSAGDISKITVTVSKDGAETPYTLHIKRKSYSFTVEASPEGAGRVHITEGKGVSVVSGNGSGNCTVKAEVGALVKMTAQEENTYTFKKWKKKIPVTSNLSTSSSYTYTVDIHDNDIIAEYAAGTVIDSTFPAAERWKKLKEAVQNAQDGDTIIIDGEIKATNDTDNSGTIVIDKNITIKAKSGTATLDADYETGGKPAHRIFKVDGASATLTLENLTLKNGYAKTAGDALGGGILVTNGGKLTLKNTTISTCIADYGGAVNVKGSSSSVTMESGSLTANTATTIGGAVNVDNGASFTMNGGTINGNIGKSGGGGVYVHAGTFTLGAGASIESNSAEGRNGGGVYVDSNGMLAINGGSIKSNEAAKSGSAVGNGGGVYVFGNTVSKGKVRMTAGEISGNAAGLDGTAYKGDGGGVYNEGGTFEMEGGDIKGNTAKNGGGVYVRDGNFTMQGSTQIAENNDIYLAGGKKIIIEGILNPEEGIAGRITPEAYPTGSTEIQVLDGDITTGTPQNYTKFTVTPQDLGDGNSAEWGITSEGKLKLTSAVIDGSGSDAWKKLKEAVAAIADGGTITINGEIKATSASGNSGEIVINKNINIKGKTEGHGAALLYKLNANATVGGKPAHRIFKVEAGGSLHLKNLSLIGGKTDTANPNGGAILMDGAGIDSTITSCVIGDSNNLALKNTAVQKGGGIYLNISGGSLTVKDTEINSCTASGTTETTGGGGGIYLQSGNLTFEGVQMKGNTAANGKGRAVWVEDGSFKIKDSSRTKTYLDPATTSSKNPDDVYLAADKTITVNGTLAGIPAGPFTSPQAARITPQNYTAGTQVLKAENGVSIGDVTNKFTVTPQTAPSENWIIDKEGRLRDFDGIGKDVIAAFDGDMSTTTIVKYNEMIGHFIFYKTNEGNYGVMTITETPPNGSGTGVYNMKFRYKTYTANGSISSATILTGTHSFDLDTGTMSTSSNQLESTRDFFLYNSITIEPKNNARFFTQNPPQ